MKTLKDIEGVCVVYVDPIPKVIPKEHIANLSSHFMNLTTLATSEKGDGMLVKYGIEVVKNPQIQDVQKIATSEELKREAIEWIKKLENGEMAMGEFYGNQFDDFVVGDYEFDNDTDIMYWKKEQTQEVVYWVKWFFNITEEDLK